MKGVHFFTTISSIITSFPLEPVTRFINCKVYVGFPVAGVTNVTSALYHFEFSGIIPVVTDATSVAPFITANFTLGFVSEPVAKDAYQAENSYLVLLQRPS